MDIFVYGNRAEGDADFFDRVGACSRLVLPYYSHRAFRRMFITNAIEKGVDIKVIAEWQGHGDGGKLILDTYSHVRRPHHDKMAVLMKDE
jgi:hypothetical protein